MWHFSSLWQCYLRLIIAIYRIINLLLTWVIRPANNSILIHMGTIIITQTLTTMKTCQLMMFFVPYQIILIETQTISITHTLPKQLFPRNNHRNEFISKIKIIHIIIIDWLQIKVRYLINQEMQLTFSCRKRKIGVEL